MRSRTKKPEVTLTGTLAGLEASTPFERCPLTGKHCAECGRPQRQTHGGVSCENGHGGASSYEDERASGKPTNALPVRDAATKSWVDDTDPRAAMTEVMGDDPVAEKVKRVTRSGKVNASTKRHVAAMVDAKQQKPAVPGEEVSAAPSPVVGDAPIPTGGNRLESLVIRSITTARAFVGQEIWTEKLRADRSGHYVNPGEHSEDCPLKRGEECECAVGYVQHVVKPGVSVAVTTRSVPEMTIGQAIEWGYVVDASFDERIAGDRDSVVIHVEPHLRPVAPTQEPASPVEDSVPEEQVRAAVAAVKQSAEKSKRAPRRPTSVGVSVSFVPVGTRVLVDVKTIEQLGEILRGPKLGGALVKVGVPVAASCRDTFDGAGIKAMLIEHGASAVMLSPRVVSDTGVTKSAKVAAAEAQSPEEAVREWFAGQTGLTDAEREQAIEIALEIMEGT